MTYVDAHPFDVAAVLSLWGPHVLMQVLAPVSDRCDQRLHELFPLETTAVAEANGWQRCPWALWEPSAWPSSASGRSFKLDENNPCDGVLVATANIPEMGSTQKGEQSRAREPRFWNGDRLGSSPSSAAFQLCDFELCFENLSELQLPTR